jgi:hypothetical protein
MATAVLLQYLLTCKLDRALIRHTFKFTYTNRYKRWVKISAPILT